MGHPVYLLFELVIHSLRENSESWRKFDEYIKSVVINEANTASSSLHFQ